MAEKKSWVVKGCLGCVVVLAVLLIFGVFSTIAAFRASSKTEPKRDELSYRLPGPGAAVAGEAEDSADGVKAVDPATPDGALELPGTIPGLSTEEPMVIDLDLSMGSFYIEPGLPGEDLKVTADYDAADFELTEDFDPDARRYRLRFRRKGMFFGFVHRGNEPENEVRLSIPPHHPIALAGKIGVGQSRVDLGGLLVESVDLEIGVGDHRFEISRPTTAPMERFQIEASIGELAIEQLGNASPRRVDVSHSVGEIRLGLEGAWRNDSEIEVSCGIGECALRLPDEVRVEVDRARIKIGEKSVRLDADRPQPEAGPTLHLSVEATLGELRIRD